RRVSNLGVRFCHGRTAAVVGEPSLRTAAGRGPPPLRCERLVRSPPIRTSSRGETDTSRDNPARSVGLVGGFHRHGSPQFGVIFGLDQSLLSSPLPLPIRRWPGFGSRFVSTLKPDPVSITSTGGMASPSGGVETSDCKCASQLGGGISRCSMMYCRRCDHISNTLHSSARLMFPNAGRTLRIFGCS